jgi:hypothetical protein
VMNALLVCILVAAGIGAAGQTQGSKAFDLFYAAIGSSKYVTTTSPNLHDFGSLPEAAKSATAVVSMLQQTGAQFGITLESTDKSVSLTDIHAAIGDVHKELVRSKASNPILLFYFVGHGISEGISWSHFSVPGTLLLDDNYEREDIAELAKHTLYAGALIDELESFGIPYIVILDTCYEGNQRSFDSAVLSKTASQNLTDVAGILRTMNEFRDTNPVLFSTTPGSVVSTVEDPLDPKSDISVGPLARRVVMILNQVIKRNVPVTLRDFVSAMTSKSLDSLTAPAVTHSVAREDWDNVLFRRSVGGRSERRLGTSNVADICCKKYAGH